MYVCQIDVSSCFRTLLLFLLLIQSVLSLLPAAVCYNGLWLLRVMLWCYQVNRSAGYHTCDLSHVYASAHVAAATNDINKRGF